MNTTHPIKTNVVHASQGNESLDVANGVHV
jgi:hypothetical protein